MRRVGRNLLAAGCMLAVYSVVPVPGTSAPPLVGWLVFAAGITGLAYTVILLVRRERRSPVDTGIRVEVLVGVLYAVVVFFSLVYLSLSTRRAEFADLHDRVDALYFTMATLGTVGFGDVHAVGRAARVAVTAQMFFDIAILGVAARLIGPSLAARRIRGRDERSVTPPG